MPTEVIKYVDPDGGILADYTSLQAAITAEKAIRSDLVARDEVLKLMCISSAGSPDTTPVVINSGDFVTDATRNLQIIGDNTTGIWSTEHFRLEVTNLNNAAAIRTEISNLTIRNLLIDFGAAAAQRAYGIILETSNTETVIENCILRNTLGTNTTDFCAHIYINNLGIVTVCNVKNTVLYNSKSTALQSAAINISQNGGMIYASNVTIYNIRNGLRRAGEGGSFTAKNVITQNCINGFSGTFADSSDYNISDLAGDAPGANSLNETTANFADAGAGDFRLLPESPGINQGVDLSSDPNYPFNTDIIGTVRPQGSAWDIGAFELIQQTFNPAWARQANKIIRAI